MDRARIVQLRDRAVALGRSADGAALPELAELLSAPAAEVRRVAASAMGKLAGVADGATAVSVLHPALRDAHPQVRQYAVKALKAYGAAAQSALHDLRDIAANPAEKPYNRRDAKLAVEVVEEACRIEEESAVRSCQRCGVRIDAGEYARSQRAFQRDFCDRCFDEVYLERRNWETKVELKKEIRARDGTFVQSDGERRIADWLTRQGLRYRYDERLRIVDGYAIRPDFYLAEFDLYIEYWGMDTIDYKIGMLKKLKLYQQQGKRLVSVYREDKPNLDAVLRAKLGEYMRIPGEDG